MCTKEENVKFEKSFANKIKAPFVKFAKCKTIQKIVERCATDSKYALTFLLIANCLKDAINCGFYVTQSLNNKEIPEEKRKFVGAYDMVSGVLYIVAQMGLGYGFLSEPVQNGLNKLLFGKVGANAQKHYEDTLSAKFHSLTADLRVTIRNASKKIPKDCKAGFKAVSTLIVANIIAKRVVVPLVSTPLAAYLKKKYMDTPTTKPVKKPVSNMQNPAVQQNINQNNNTYQNTAGSMDAFQQYTNPNPRLNSIESFRNFTQKGTMFHY